MRISVKQIFFFMRIFLRLLRNIVEKLDFWTVKVFLRKL